MSYSSSNGGNSASVGRRSPNAGTSALPSTGGAPSPTGTKRFDPFAPLDHTPSTYNPPSRGSPNNNSSSAASSASYQSPSSSPNLSGNSFSRAARPSSLYIPMEDTPSGGLLANGTGANGAAGGAAPGGAGGQWPFRGGLTSEDRRGSHVFPSSPSMINPSYADLGAPPAHTTDYSAVPTPPLGAPSAGKELLYSSISVGEESRSTTPSRRGLTGGAKGQFGSQSGLMSTGRREEPSEWAKRLDTVRSTLAARLSLIADGPGPAAHRLAGPLLCLQSRFVSLSTTWRARTDSP